MRNRKIDADISDLLALEVAAPAPEISEMEQIETLLEENGFTLEQASKAAVLLEPYISDLVLKRSGETLRHLLLKLSNTSAGIALQRVILGDDGESLRDAGKRVTPKPISGAGMLKLERTIRQRLTLGTYIEN